MPTASAPSTGHRGREGPPLVRRSGSPRCNCGMRTLLRPPSSRAPSPTGMRVCPGMRNAAGRRANPRGPSSPRPSAT
eukprot:5550483-Prymnesium_polylepis.1